MFLFHFQDNLFEWHFTVQGPADSDFESGRYHGRIILPPEYPMKPPSIMLLTVSMVDGIGVSAPSHMTIHNTTTYNNPQNSRYHDHLLGRSEFVSVIYY